MLISFLNLLDTANLGYFQQENIGVVIEYRAKRWTLSLQQTAAYRSNTNLYGPNWELKYLLTNCLKFRDNWRVGASNLLSTSLGVVPFKNTFWSSHENPGNAFYHECMEGEDTSGDDNLPWSTSYLYTGDINVSGIMLDIILILASIVKV